MKRQIRNSVFETNSSSVHSLVIKPGSMRGSTLKVDEDNKVEVDFGIFELEVCDYSDQYTKLQYILTMCACTEGKECVTPYDFFNTKGFKDISNAVAKHCNCDGIKIDKENMWTVYSDYCREGRLSFDGCIDHQSCEDYESISEYLEQKNISSVEEFIFNDGITIHTDHDNY